MSRAHESPDNKFDILCGRHLQGHQLDPRENAGGQIKEARHRRQKWQPG